MSITPTYTAQELALAQHSQTIIRVSFFNGPHPGEEFAGTAYLTADDRLVMDFHGGLSTAVKLSPAAAEQARKTMCVTDTEPRNDAAMQVARNREEMARLRQRAIEAGDPDGTIAARLKGLTVATLALRGSGQHPPGDGPQDRRPG